MQVWSWIGIGVLGLLSLLNCFWFWKLVGMAARSLPIAEANARSGSMAETSLVSAACSLAHQKGTNHVHIKPVRIVADCKMPKEMSRI